MRRAGLATIVFMAATALAQDRAAEEKLLEGKWVMESIEFKDGKKEPPENLEKLVMTFKGSTFTATNVINGVEHKGVSKMTLDPTCNPKLIDLERLGTKSIGIYRLQGDELLICINGVSNDRPTEFKTAKDSPFQLWKLKRIKETAK